MPDQLDRVISKSKYISGLQCHKLIWHQYNAKEVIPPYDASQQAVFAQGHEVGRRARQLYPGGVLIERERWDMDGQLEDTALALLAGTPIYEAAFRGAGVYAQIDILVPADLGRWDIVEVKSSTSVKSSYLDDVALQRHAAESSGTRIRNCLLAHIDGTYVRPAVGPSERPTVGRGFSRADVENDKLFRVVDITSGVAERLPSVPERVEALASVIQQPLSPVIPIGRHCTSPHDCPLIPVCWSAMPEENVTRLVGGSKKRLFELVDQGVVSIQDLPDDFDLNTRQAIQVETARSRTPHVDGPRVRAFLDGLTYPLFFLDFETFGTAVPLLDGTRPYRQVPFQFSLHVRREPGGELTHHSFLAGGAGDPRPELLRKMQEWLEEAGSIVAYFAKFETGRLQELARQFPAHVEWIEQILARVVDLHAPFKAFDIYYPAQNGSTSLKSVLPALTGSGYDGMAIADGGTASRAFLRIVFGNESGEDVADADTVRRDLEAYCALDTLAMVRILDEMERMAR